MRSDLWFYTQPWINLNHRFCFSQRKLRSLNARHRYSIISTTGVLSPFSPCRLNRAGRRFVTAKHSQTRNSIYNPSFGNDRLCARFWAAIASLSREKGSVQGRRRALSGSLLPLLAPPPLTPFPRRGVYITLAVRTRQLSGWPSLPRRELPLLPHAVCHPGTRPAMYLPSKIHSGPTLDSACASPSFIPTSNPSYARPRSRNSVEEHA